MLEATVFKVDAFTNDGQGGNSAGVVLDAGELTDDQMQQIASFAGFSETVFVSLSPQAVFRLRFFSPTTEVDMCAHATIAACSILSQRDSLLHKRFTVVLNVGELVIEVQADGKILMTLPLPSLAEESDADAIAVILGIDYKSIADTNLQPQVIAIGTRQLIVPIASAEVLRTMKPNLQAMASFNKQTNTMGMYVFTSNGVPRDIDAFCRSFWPLYGCDEESATGGASGALGYYLSQHVQLKPEYIFIQGPAMPNPSKLYVSMHENEGEIIGVTVGGYATQSGTQSYTV